MSIHVTVDNISTENYNKIIDFYNRNKLEEDSRLERLDRCEGGFQIQIPEKQNKKGDVNEKIKQLRWDRKQLVGFKNYKTFNEQELLLLFWSMKNVLGDSVLFIS
jgi:hypothetical protein